MTAGEAFQRDIEQVARSLSRHRRNVSRLQAGSLPVRCGQEAQMKNEYPGSKERGRSSRRSGRWIFGMTIVIALAVFALLVLLQGGLRGVDVEGL